MNYESILGELALSGNLRKIPGSDGGDAVDFTTNDYLGLSRRQDLYEQFVKSAADGGYALTASASRLLAPSQQAPSELETLLDRLYGDGRRSLLFNSGYHANTGLISALADRDTIVLADRLVHASIIDGILLSRAEFHRFPHNDMAALRRLLERFAPTRRTVMVVVESVYSMDGDQPSIEALVSLKREFPGTMLYVDEAHGFGVCGPQGLGVVCGVEGALEQVDVLVGTLGKAAASVGAFATMSPRLREFAVNRARSFIFSTALPPLNVAWSRLMVETITTMDRERLHLAWLGERLSAGLASLSPDHKPTPSHIVPFIVGDPRLAVELSEKLRRDGFKVLPIRTPTVPAGTERLRISLSAALTGENIDGLVESLRRNL
ncbi:MAG: 8-amino-7-oxononanoate synthase [Clostridium sp.]|nr:8-amino-7-oxononanoate synthase [Clostridium sp.]